MNSNKNEIIKKRDELYNEVTQLEMDKAKIESKLKVKKAALKEICTCDTRTGHHEYSQCDHCGEIH